MINRVPVRLLLVEDNPDDVEQVERALRADGLACELRTVANDGEFRSALRTFAPDLVVVDWTLPGFSGADALRIVREEDERLPRILLSGTLGEDLIVQALRSKATDYVAKGHIEGLAPAVRRAMAEAELARERARLEADLAKTQHAMNGSLDAMADAFVLCTAVRGPDGAIADFEVQFVNRAAAAFMGRDPATLIRTSLRMSMSANQHLDLLAACSRVVETGETYARSRMSVLVPSTAGPVGPLVDLVITRFEDGCFLVFRDVTERVQLTEDRERLAAVVEQTIDGIVITDAAGVILYANPAFTRSAGHPAANLVGQPAEHIATEIIGGEAMRAITAAAVEAKPWLGEVDRVATDGTVNHIEVSVTPAHDDHDRVTGYVVVSRDVTALREAQAELALEGRIRLALATCLRDIPDDATLAEAAQKVCDELTTIEHIDLAAVEAFDARDRLEVVAASCPPGLRLKPGQRLPIRIAQGARRRAANGPWAQYWDPGAGYGRWGRDFQRAGMQAIAFGPIAHGEELLGGVVIGTLDRRFAHTLVEKMPAALSISASSSAILAQRLYAVRRQSEQRDVLARMLHAHAYSVVFQPIVDLEALEVVGYEALSRFDSGQRPDLCFADAWSVGLGSELELATLALAVETARRLPSGRWLDLNVSPPLLLAAGRLAAILGSADRPIVLEVTEHHLIEDYGTIREAIRSYGPNVRLAVDDAGAGVANFSHIIGLRPDFVKLDIGLTRGVNVDLGRQSLVRGMLHFSRSAGCRLVAEGIETEEEARTLADMGVDFAQGFLYGRPEPVEAWQGRTSGTSETDALRRATRIARIGPTSGAVPVHLASRPERQRGGLRIGG